MEFKLKNRVQLYDNDTVLLDLLLDDRREALTSMIDDIRYSLSMERYHELCHQGFLYQLDPSFSADDGEIHNNEMIESVIKMDGEATNGDYKEAVAYIFTSSPLAWNVYLSTTYALNKVLDDWD